MRKPNNLTNTPIVQVKSKRVSFDETAPITYNDVDEIYIFYTPEGRLVQSETYDEAHAKWLLARETD